jgi:hypothetical protein
VVKQTGEKIAAKLCTQRPVCLKTNVCFFEFGGALPCSDSNNVPSKPAHASTPVVTEYLFCQFYPSFLQLKTTFGTFQVETETIDFTKMMPGPWGTAFAERLSRAFQMFSAALQFQGART